MPTRFRFTAVALAAAGLAACGDASDPSHGSPTVPEPAFAPVSAACSTSGLASLARSYFSNPEQKTATETLRAMQDQCAGLLYAEAEAGGWSVLSTMETVLEQGRGGSAADGAALANGVISYMCGLGTGVCDAPNDYPALVSASDLGSQGIFAVRVGGAVPVIARGKVPFTAFGSGPNAALWGIQTSSDWHAATTAPKILFFGSPASAGDVDLAETPFGSLGYQLHTFPDVPHFADQQLLVGACYDSEVALPHENDNPSLPTLGERMQREGTLLNPALPDCDGWTSFRSASVASGLLARMARFADWAFAPQPLWAAVFGDRRAPAVGGTPLDFSNFAPVAASRTGYLQFMVPPDGAFDNGTAGVAFDPILVQAFSGSGTPMELVRVELYVAGNEGVPAGATFCDPELPGADDPSCSVFDTDANGDFIITQEQPDGDDPYATFEGVTLYKAGGFRVCVRAEPTYYIDDLGATQVDFTFTEACSQLFNMKNR